MIYTDGPPVRIAVDRRRMVYWDGAPYARWPSSRRPGRWGFAAFVRFVRVYVGPVRSWELTRYRRSDP